MMLFCNSYHYSSMQIFPLNIFSIVFIATIDITMVDNSIKKYVKYLYNTKCVSLKTNIDAIVTAVNGKVNAHQEIKNFKFKKFLYINNNKNIKNSARLYNALANISYCMPFILRYAISATAGGAININSVGINLPAN